MPITTNLSKEELERGCKTLVVQQVEGGYLIQIPIIGLHKVPSFNALMCFLRGYYEDGKDNKKEN